MARVKHNILEPEQNPIYLSSVKLIPSGSTLFNLACSDTINGAFLPGKVVNLIGDKSTGKTFLYLTMLAEICQSSIFDKYELYHDDVEAAVEFDTDYLFGEKLSKRLRSPWNGSGSATIQDFHTKIFELINRGKPFIYGLDSFDALTSDEEISKFNQKVGGKTTKGSYALERTKGLGAMFRQITQGIKKTGSLLVIISQVRENISEMPFTPKYRRTGGRALGHYSSYELWLSFPEKSKIKKNDHIIGINCLAKFTKNRMTGKVRNALFPIYYDYGVDDISSCIDFLIKEGHWKHTNKTVVTKEFGTYEKQVLINLIEKDGRENDVRNIVGQVWTKIEEDLKLNRKKKYT